MRVEFPHLATVYFAVKDTFRISPFDEEIVNHPDKLNLDNIADSLRESAGRGTAEPESVRNFLRAHTNYFEDRAEEGLKNMQPVTSERPSDMSVFENRKASYESRKTLHEFNSVRFVLEVPFIPRQRRNATAERLVKLLYGEEYDLERFTSEFPQAAKNFQRLVRVA